MSSSSSAAAAFPFPHIGGSANIQPSVPPYAQPGVPVVQQVAQPHFAQPQFYSQPYFGAKESSLYAHPERPSIDSQQAAALREAYETTTTLEKARDHVGDRLLKVASIIAIIALLTVAGIVTAGTPHIILLTLGAACATGLLISDVRHVIKLYTASEKCDELYTNHYVHGIYHVADERLVASLRQPRGYQR